MKASAGLGSPLQRRGIAYRIKATPSYVDESLFSSHRKHQPAGPDFEPPWRDGKTWGQRPLLWSPETTRVDAGPLKSPPPASTPRKRNKYRLKSHTPSYCDETLFGSKPGGQEWTASWAAREDVAKLRPLLWTPPSAPRDLPALFRHPKMVTSQGKDRFEANRRVETSLGKQPANYSDTATQIMGRPRSQSFTRLYNASDRFHPAGSNKQQDQRTSTAAPGPLPTPCLSARASSSRKEKPPWK
ncbi:RBPJ-interacting and tubulin-associated protein 1 [Candoia aspera]|uniref:RBPJ-interacting and tubulin-associated protein 1 n=1 Tax=Candoia aspera TaxID=51853 RepID=UPI002FD7FDFC